MARLCSDIDRGRAAQACWWSTASTCSQFLICSNGPLEVVIFRAGNQAELFERGQELLGLGGLAKHQIGFAEMRPRAAMAWIQRQRLLIMADGRTKLAQPPIGIADIGLDIGVERVAQCGGLERRDRSVPILPRERLFEIGR